MYKQFLRDRISQLRIQKNVSEYQMSLDLGRSRGYIQNISSGSVLPSVGGLFDICDYFGLTPAQFFDEGTENPARLAEVIEGLHHLNDHDLALVKALIDRFAQES